MFRLEKALWAVMLVSGILFFLSACGNHKHSTDRALTSKSFESEKEFFAPRKIKDSFVLAEQGTTSTNQGSNTNPNAFILDQTAGINKDPNMQRHEKFHSFAPPHHAEGLQTLGLRKASLDKEFLLRTNLIQGGLAPDFHNLKSRVVAFTLKAGRLFLVEATQGHAYYHDIPQQLILTDFEVDHEDDDTIYFNFNSGMTKLYTQGDWYAQDFSGSDPAHFSEQFQAVNIANSYSETVSFNQEKEYLFVKQIAQIQDGSSYLPIEVRYYFQPYEPSKDFTPTISPRQKKHYGFFEVNPTISQETKKSRTLASKFNINKPIIFAISDNTPKEYRDTIKEGILYWNKAFGSEKIQVIDAPKGLSAPQYDYNMVQWIDWDDASHAYADAQMDPRTGEILNVQIYMSSVFAIKGKQQAREAIRKLLATHSEADSASSRQRLEKLLKGNNKSEIKSFLSGKEETRSKKKIGLRGFFQEPLCDDHTHLESLAISMTELLGENLSEEVFFEVSKDHLREAIAHEVGHTLGLRHNFAGFLAGNYDLEQKDDIFSHYVKDAQVPDDLVVTSSIMDYMPFQESAIAGHQVKNNHKAFSYDEMAIQILYQGKKISDYASKPLYCTDSHANRYIDCQIWGIGSSPIAYTKYQTQKNLEDFPKMLAEYFISNSKSVEADEEPLPFDHVLMPSLRWSISLLNPRLKALESMLSGSRSLRLDREFGFVSEGNSERINERFASWIHEEVAIHGDGHWSNILDKMPANFGAWVSTEFSRIIRSETYKSGVGPAGAYTFTDAEIEMMCAAVADYMTEMEQSLATVDIIQLYYLEGISNQEIKSAGKDIDDGFVSYLKDKARNIIFAQKEAGDENSPMHDFEVGLLEVNAKATVEASSEREYIAKVLILKSMLEKVELPFFLIDDQEYTKAYSEKELEMLATERLNAQLNDLVAQIDLSQIFPEEMQVPEDQSATEHNDSSTQLNNSTSDPVDMDIDDDTDISDLKISLITSKSNSILHSKNNDFPVHFHASLLETLKAKEQSIKEKWHQALESIDNGTSDSDLPSPKSLDPNLSASSEDAQNPSYSLDVPVTLYFPVALPSFKYNFETRFWASKLLDKSKGESIAFGMRDRDKLSDEFAELYKHYLRGFKIKDKSLSRQAKNVNTWIQKNTIILSNLLGL
ncbi:MAG: zinc-dependent metalloprotease [Oligoflexales bacterium]|nr:zinc-dependent metalloprotease [Oligoflexales bacterium]